MFVLFSLLGLTSGVGGLIGFAAMFLLGTAVWHAIAGRSWLSPLAPLSRRQALIALPASLAVMVGGFAAAAPANDRTTAIPEASTSTTTSTTTASTPSDVLTPSATQSDATSASESATATSSTSATPTTKTVVASAPPSSVKTGTTALTVLASIPIKGRAPMTGYSRDQFGQAWFDWDRNGCDTRNDILRRDLVNITVKSGTNGCVVLTGTLHDPYTARTISFVRGQGTSTIVQIDHVVALGDAWQKGAQKLSAAQRLALANDPLNLLAVYGPTNESKGDGDAATWLPPNKSFRCSYVARQTAVKAKYALWMTQAEHDAIARVLSTCPNQTVPSSTVRPPVTWSTATATATTTSPKPVVKATTTAPKPASTTTTATTSAVSYANCTAMHVDYPHGVARRGGVDLVNGIRRVPQPAYFVSDALYYANTARDGDHDGVACEKP